MSDRCPLGYLFFISESTASENTETLKYKEFTEKDKSNTVDFTSARLNRKAIQKGGNPDFSSNDPSSASLRVAISALAEKLEDVMIQNQSFEESQKLQNNNQLMNIIYACDKQLDDLVNETFTGRMNKGSHNKQVVIQGHSSVVNDSATTSTDETLSELRQND